MKYFVLCFLISHMLVVAHVVAAPRNAATPTTTSTRPIGDAAWSGIQNIRRTIQSKMVVLRKSDSFNRSSEPVIAGAPPLDEQRDYDAGVYTDDSDMVGN